MVSHISDFSTAGFSGFGSCSFSLSSSCWSIYPRLGFDAFFKFFGVFLFFCFLFKNFGSSFLLCLTLVREYLSPVYDSCVVSMSASFLSLPPLLIPIVVCAHRRKHA